MASTPSPPISSADPDLAAATPAVVLDTNAVLDWLVFRHISCLGWESRFAAGSVRWLASAAMREELAHVLDRGVGGDRVPDMSALWAAWDRWAMPAEAAHLAPPASHPRCTDAGDQKFIDLALAHRARWLVSRDRAVLKLARRARPLGLHILTPEAWEMTLSVG